jgi:hypothetical protein
MHPELRKMWEDYFGKCFRAMPLPEQEPVAYFDWLPEGATHIAQIKVKTRSGGRLEIGAYVFKYDN